MYTESKNTRPGKYEGNDSQLEAEIVHMASLEGCSETVGDVIERGWHTSLVLGRRYGWIVYEDDLGFVDVTSFNTPEEATRGFEMFQQAERKKERRLRWVT